MMSDPINNVRKCKKSQKIFFNEHLKTKMK